MLCVPRMLIPLRHHVHSFAPCIAELSRQRIDEHAHPIPGSARFELHLRTSFTQVLDRGLELIALGAQLIHVANRRHGPPHRDQRDADRHQRHDQVRPGCAPQREPLHTLEHLRRRFGFLVEIFERGLDRFARCSSDPALQLRARLI
jgi:hypothetical protein